MPQPINIGEDRSADQIAADIQAAQGNQEAAEDQNLDNEEGQEDGDQGEPTKPQGEGSEGGEGEDDDDEIDLDSLEESQEDPNKPEKKEDKKEDDEEDPLSDEDNAAIDKAVEKRLAPLREQQQVAEKEKRDSAFNSYLNENPHLKKYGENIRPYIHKFYDTMVKSGVNGVKIKEERFFDSMVGMVLNKGLLKVGAKMERAAKSKSSKGSQSAAGTRPQDNDGKLPNARDMSNADFQKLQEQVLNGEYKE